jgi:hypothetical protein
MGCGKNLDIGQPDRLYYCCWKKSMGQAVLRVMEEVCRILDLFIILDFFHPCLQDFSFTCFMLSDFEP